MKKGTGFVNLANARSEEQLAVMKQIATDGVCPFCPEHLEKFHKKPILKQTAHWLVTENQWPYKNTKVHLIFIARVHITKLSSLDPSAWFELGRLLSWAEEEYEIEGGGFGFRFGDIAINNATVNHLHAQLAVVDITDHNDPKYKPVRFRVG